jgi:hypothetical protein
MQGDAGEGAGSRWPDEVRDGVKDVLAGLLSAGKVDDEDEDSPRGAAGDDGDIGRGGGDDVVLEEARTEFSHKPTDLHAGGEVNEGFCGRRGWNSIDNDMHGWGELGGDETEAGIVCMRIQAS